MIVRLRPSVSPAAIAGAAFHHDNRAVERLESLYATRFGFPHGVFFPYARSALFSLLKALGLEGRDVLCPSYICAVVPYAISATRNNVRFVDSASDHFLPGVVEWQRTVGTDAAMAVIPPLFGYPVDLGCVELLRRESPNVFILFDEAQSYGVSDVTGLQCRVADGMLLSLGLGKMLTSLSGGLLFLRDDAIAGRVREFRNHHFREERTSRKLRLAATAILAMGAYTEPTATLADMATRTISSVARFAHGRAMVDDADMPADAMTMPSEFEATIGIDQLRLLDQIIEGRKRIGNYYERRFRESGVQTFSHLYEPTWPRYPFTVSNRPDAIAALRERGIQVGLFIDYECSRLPLYRHGPPMQNAIHWSETMINLPDWFGMAPRQAERVVEAVLSLPRHSDKR